VKRSEVSKNVSASPNNSWGEGGGDHWDRGRKPPNTPPPLTLREGLGDRRDGERAPGTDTQSRRAGDGDGRRGGIR